MDGMEGSREGELPGLHKPATHVRVAGGREDSGEGACREREEWMEWKEGERRDCTSPPHMSASPPAGSGVRAGRELQAHRLAGVGKWP